MATAGRSPIWLWINLLSLDAPLVALIWQDFVVRCYPSVLLPQGRWVLGLTVWAIYIADRLLDVRKDVRAPSPETEGPRHRFYRAHKQLATVALAVILSADLLITLLWLRPAVFVNGIIVATAALAYLCVFTGHGARWAFWKKSAAAILFTAGVFLVPWTWTPNPVDLLLWPAVTFALLCKGNLVLIEHWERGWPAEVVWIALLLFALLVAGAGQSRWYYAVALSCAGLAALALAGERISGDARRVLADVALMSPLLFG